MDILDISEKKLKIVELEKQIESGNLSLFERCEVEEEILQLKEEIGEFVRNIESSEGDCINCSG